MAVRIRLEALRGVAPLAHTGMMCRGHGVTSGTYARLLELVDRHA